MGFWGVGSILVFYLFRSISPSISHNFELLPFIHAFAETLTPKNEQPLPHNLPLTLILTLFAVKMLFKGTQSVDEQVNQLLMKNKVKKNIFQNGKSDEHTTKAELVEYNWEL